jgi:hypothetical protein
MTPSVHFSSDCTLCVPPGPGPLVHETGVYRFWRDLSYAVGALLSGLIADTIGLGAAIHVVAVLTLASGNRGLQPTPPNPIPA